jgi:hypothetical protein
MTDMKDADLRDVVLLGMVLVDVVRRFGAASKGAAEAKVSAAAANTKLIGSSDRVV